MVTGTLGCAPVGRVPFRGPVCTFFPAARPLGDWRCLHGTSAHLLPREVDFVHQPRHVVGQQVSLRGLAAGRLALTVRLGPHLEKE